MFDEYAVRLAVEYLETKFARGKPADLIGMLNYVDYQVRVVMGREEIDEVLKVCPSVHVEHIDGRIVFTQSPGDREIIEEDLNREIRMYNDELRDKYRFMKMFLWWILGVLVVGAVARLVLSPKIIFTWPHSLPFLVVVCSLGVVPVGMVWMGYMVAKHERRAVPYFFLGSIPYFFLGYYIERVRRRDPRDRWAVKRMVRREQWQRVLLAEVTRWSSMSCEGVLAELQSKDIYEVIVELKHYQVEVVLLENTPEYLHVSIAVDDGSLPASICPASDSFICQKA